MTMLSQLIAFQIGNDIADSYLNLSQDAQVTGGLITLGVVFILFAKYCQANICKSLCCSHLKWMPCILVFIALTLLFIQVFGCIHVRQSVMNMWFMALLACVIYIFYRCEMYRKKINELLRLQQPIVITVVKETVEDEPAEPEVNNSSSDPVATDVIAEEGNSDSGVSLETDVVSNSVIAEDGSVST